VLFVGSAAVMALVPWGLGWLTAALMAPGHERVWTALMVLVGLLIARAVLDLVSARLLQLGTSRLLVALHSDAADGMMAPTMLSRTERLEECRALQADLGRWVVSA